MSRPTLAAFAYSSLLTIAACQTQDPSAPDGAGSDNLKPTPSLPTASASLDCRFSPSGSIHIAVGQIKTFAVTSGNCTGARGVITPQGSPNSAAFIAVEGVCTLVQQTFPPFKVKKCTTAPATFRIYTDFSQTTLLQTILIDVP
jgi:hypothetical protein